MLVLMLKLLEDVCVGVLDACECTCRARVVRVADASLLLLTGVECKATMHAELSLLNMIMIMAAAGNASM
jgi:hypothetical protein